MRSLALALLLAAAPLVSGCVSAVCDPPLVTITWQLYGPSGAAWDCDTATTKYVDIYIGPVYQSFPCSAYGATLDMGGVAPGTYLATVEGIDGDGSTIWSRDQFNVTVGDCNANPVYAAKPGEATLALDYVYPAGDTCNGGYMWYALFDEIAGNTISAIYGDSSDADKTLYPCGGTIPPGQTYQVELAVPFGTFTLDWMQEVVTPTTAPDPKYQYCGPSTPVDVWAPAVTALTVPMTPYAAACPPIP